MPANSNPRRNGGNQRQHFRLQQIRDHQIERDVSDRFQPSGEQPQPLAEAVGESVVAGRRGGRVGNRIV